MATPLVRSSLRRSCAPTGVLALLCLVFAATSLGATPAPDPPPVAVAPELPPVAKTVPARVPVRRARATVAPVRVVHRAAPAAAAQPARLPTAKLKPTLRPKPTKRPRATERATLIKRNAVTASKAPHDRGPVPLAAFAPTVEELNRGLAAFAGAALAFVALGGALVLLTARRELAR